MFDVLAQGHGEVATVITNLLTLHDCWCLRFTSRNARLMLTALGPQRALTLRYEWCYLFGLLDSALGVQSCRSEMEDVCRFLAAITGLATDAVELQLKRLVKIASELVVLEEKPGCPSARLMQRRPQAGGAPTVFELIARAASFEHTLITKIPVKPTSMRDDVTSVTQPRKKRRLSRTLSGPAPVTDDEIIQAARLQEEYNRLLALRGDCQRWMDIVGGAKIARLLIGELLRFANGDEVTLSRVTQLLGSGNMQQWLPAGTASQPLPSDVITHALCLLFSKNCGGLVQIKPNIGCANLDPDDIQWRFQSFHSERAQVLLEQENLALQSRLQKCSQSLSMILSESL